MSPKGDDDDSRTLPFMVKQYDDDDDDVSMDERALAYLHTCISSGHLLHRYKKKKKEELTMYTTERIVDYVPFLL